MKSGNSTPGARAARPESSLDRGRPMKTLLRKAQILAMGGPHGDDPFEGDLLVEDDRIAAIGADLGEIHDARVIEGRDRLVMPGLVNAHLHSSEQFFKGRYERMPLELASLRVSAADGPSSSRAADLSPVNVGCNRVAEERRHYDLRFSIPQRSRWKGSAPSSRHMRRRAFGPMSRIPSSTSRLLTRCPSHARSCRLICSARSTPPRG